MPVQREFISNTGTRVVAGSCAAAVPCNVASAQTLSDTQATSDWMLLAFGLVVGLAATAVMYFRNRSNLRELTRKNAAMSGQLKATLEAVQNGVVGLTHDGKIAGKQPWKSGVVKRAFWVA